MVFKLNVAQQDFYAVTTNNKIFINCNGKPTIISLPEDKSSVKIDANVFSKSYNLLAVVYSDKCLKIWKKSEGLLIVLVVIEIIKHEYKFFF